jgi:hypothetical protein
MTREELDAALAARDAATAPGATRTAPATTPAPMTVNALVTSQAVTEDGLERRMATLARAEAAERTRGDRARAAEAQRAGIELRPMHPKLRAALEHRTLCALFLGPTGCGKTSAAEWIMVGRRCHLVRSRDLASASRRHGLGDGYPPEVERAREPRLVVIDDVGSEGPDVTTLQDVLDHRYGLGYPTIVTTGLTVTELRAHLGAAYYRRIVDQHVLKSDGTEFRVLIVDCHGAAP